MLNILLPSNKTFNKSSKALEAVLYRQHKGVTYFINANYIAWLYSKHCTVSSTYKHLPHTKQDRESLKKGRTLNSPPYVSGSFGSHCRRERHADTYSAVAFTGFISARSVNDRTREAGRPATDSESCSDPQNTITVRTQSTRLHPTPQAKSVIWHDSRADERLWVVCLLTCQSFAGYWEDPPDDQSGDNKLV